MGKLGQHADSWGAFQLRYISYKKKPTWNLWLHGPNARGRLSLSNIEHMLGEGRRAIARLNEAIRQTSTHVTIALAVSPASGASRSIGEQSPLRWIISTHGCVAVEVIPSRTHEQPAGPREELMSLARALGSGRRSRL